MAHGLATHADMQAGRTLLGVKGTPHLLRRLAAVLSGAVSIGVGVSVLLAAGVGVAPFDALNQGLAGHLGVGVGTASWIVSGVAVLAAWALGHRPGWGTLSTAAVTGLVINLLLPLLPQPQSLLVQVPYATGGLLALLWGIGLVIAGNFGAGAIDLLMLALADARRVLPVHLGIRNARWLLEALLVLGAWVLGGDIGAFTIVIVVVSGPALAWLVPRVNHWVRPSDHESGPTPLSSGQRVGALLTVAGSLGLTAAIALTVEKIRVLQDTAYVPECDLNPVLSCGSVINTAQASAFGFPNPILGLVGFTVVVTLGVLLTGRVEFPVWVWRGLNTGALLGFGFVNWLVFQSLYVIGSLCPWCIVVWVVTAPVLVAVTAENLRRGRLWVTGGFAAGLASLRYVILFSWYGIVAALIFLRWQDYWLGA